MRSGWCVSVPGNLAVGALAALVYAGYSLATGTQAAPAVLGRRGDGGVHVRGCVHRHPGHVGSSAMSGRMPRGCVGRGGASDFPCLGFVGRLGGGVPRGGPGQTATIFPAPAPATVSTTAVPATTTTVPAPTTTPTTRPLVKAPPTTAVKRVAPRKVPPHVARPRWAPVMPLTELAAGGGPARHPATAHRLPPPPIAAPVVPAPGGRVGQHPRRHRRGHGHWCSRRRGWC